MTLEGKVVFVPWNADSVGVFDPSTDDFTAVDISASVTGAEKFSGGVLTPDGAVVLVPYSAVSPAQVDNNITLLTDLPVLKARQVCFN